MVTNMFRVSHSRSGYEHSFMSVVICLRHVSIGSGVFCLVCFHGGHVEHMKAWFSTNTECPTGCGCECLKHMGTFRDIVMDQCSVTPSMSPASEDVPDCSDGSRQGDGVVLSGKSSMSTPRPHLPQLLRTVASTPSVRKITWMRWHVYI